MNIFRDKHSISDMLRMLADSIDDGNCKPEIKDFTLTMPPLEDREYNGAVKSTEFTLKLYGVHVHEYHGFKVE